MTCPVTTSKLMNQDKCTMSDVLELAPQHMAGCIGRSGALRSKACTPVNSSMLIVRSPFWLVRGHSHRPRSHRRSSRPAAHRAPRSTSSGNGAVADPLFQQIARMPWRNLLTMPRVTSSSAISRPVHWLIGRLPSAALHTPGLPSGSVVAL